MRFTEIANPEDQLALWKLVSDKMWDTFRKQLGSELVNRAIEPSVSVPQVKGGADQIPSAQNLLQKKPLPASGKPIKRKTMTKSKGRAVKPARTPMAPPPKPLPKPTQLPPTPTQAKQAQTQQHQQLAHHIQQALAKKSPGPSHPQSTQPQGVAQNSVVPMNNSYNERDKDELVFHNRQNPLKPLEIKNR